MKAIDLREIMPPTAHEKDIEFLKLLLQLNPAGRITAAQVY